jgi:hypothetical protein
MRRKSGLQSDPKGIAGIAAMATKSHILADFKGLDRAPLDQIHKRLRTRRYIWTFTTYRTTSHHIALQRSERRQNPRSPTATNHLCNDLRAYQTVQQTPDMDNNDPHAGRDNPIDTIEALRPEADQTSTLQQPSVSTQQIYYMDHANPSA